MTHCKYCAQSSTKLDGFGYCIKYDCFDRSGKRNIVDLFIKRAKDLYFVTGIRQTSRHVTSYYNIKEKAAEDLRYDCIKEFGFIPTEVFDALPFGILSKRWDRNCRW